jgi:hypothetical protein
MASLHGILNMDMDYPGIEIKVELIVLREYLGQMEAGISAICSTYIEAELKKYEGCDYHEYRHIYDIAEEEMPRMIRLPFVVTIFTLFENSVGLLLSYAQQKENKALALIDIKAKSLMSGFNKYLEHVLAYEFRFSDRAMENINGLQKVRNCVAHTNGNIVSMSQSKFDDFRKISERVPGITIGSRNVEVNKEFLEHSLAVVTSALREIMKYIERRYGFESA